MSTATKIPRFLIRQTDRFSVGDLFKATVGMAAIWSSRRRSSRALARLQPHLLHDVGLDRPTCEAEVGRAFWKE